MGREREPERTGRKEPEILHLMGGAPWEESYERLKHIGSGGFSDVFLARRKRDGAKVALKILRGFAQGVATVSPELSSAFQREAELWRRLKHDHIVQLLDFGRRSVPWMAVEYMAGGTLADRLGKLTLRLTLQIFLSICTALEFAHEGGVVHRDIKPENILYNEREVPKLSDWGSARHKLFASYSRDSSGTFLYYAPEQANPQSFGTYGHAGDVFQLGMVFYEALCGRHPFLLEGENRLSVGPLAVPHRVEDLKFRVPPPSCWRAEVTQELDEVILTCLCREQKGRYREAWSLR